MALADYIPSLGSAHVGRVLSFLWGLALGVLLFSPRCASPAAGLLCTRARAPDPKSVAAKTFDIGAGRKTQYAAVPVACPRSGIIGGM